MNARTMPFCAAQSTRKERRVSDVMARKERQMNLVSMNKVNWRYRRLHIRPLHREEA